MVHEEAGNWGKDVDEQQGMHTGLPYNNSLIFLWLLSGGYECPPCFGDGVMLPKVLCGQPCRLVRRFKNAGITKSAAKALTIITKGTSTPI